MFTADDTRTAHEMARILRPNYPTYRAAYARACADLANHKRAELANLIAARDIRTAVFAQMGGYTIEVVEEEPAPVATVPAPTPRRRWGRLAAAVAVTVATFAAPVVAFAAPLWGAL